MKKFYLIIFTLIIVSLCLCGCVNDSVSPSTGSSTNTKEFCSSCGKYVNRVIEKKDIADVSHDWCATCWNEYDNIMGR